MRIDDLRNFLVVADVGNLRVASEQLGLSQSALSKMLARLEDSAGLRLFDRTPWGVQLTQAGRTLLDYANRMELARHDLERALTEQRAARSGTIRVGTLPLLVSFLIPVISKFIGYRPLATVTFEAHLSAPLIGLLQAGKADLVVAAMPETIPEGIQTVPLGTLVMRMVARSTHPRLSRFTALQGVSEERWVLPSNAHYLRAWLEQRFAAAGLPAPRVAVESQTSLVPLADLIRQSDLLGILPTQMLAMQANPSLIALDVAGAHWEHQLAVCWRSHNALSPLCAEFRDTVIEHCAAVGV